jgi:coproporphyrinogen III oxidase
MHAQTSQANRLRATEFFEELQDIVCAKLDELDANEHFREDAWSHGDGGGGRTRILHDGAIFEKAGVNTSVVTGELSEALARRMNVPAQPFHATGISLVIHPLSQKVPAVRANFRYPELGNNDAWFGGGSDLTPWYLFDEDARHFHSVWKLACDRHDPEYYPKFKKWCDEYFFLKHRGEARGVGGIFFDYLPGDFEILFSFVRACGHSILESYVPIVERRRHLPWGDQERRWQLSRRGRHVELNLIYDRGTLFGLETRGRVESILVSLPPVAHWDYDFKPDPGSPEDRLLQVLRSPRGWTS